MNARERRNWLDRVLGWIEPEDYPTVTGVATLAALAAYWLAHGYAHRLGGRLTGPAEHGRRRSLRQQVTAVTWSAAGGELAFEPAGGLRRRLPLMQLLSSAIVGVALAAALIAVKLLLH